MEPNFSPYIPKHWELTINYMMDGCDKTCRHMTLRNPDNVIVGDRKDTIYYIDDELPGEALDMIQKNIGGDATLKIHVYVEEYIPTATRMVPFNYR
jgi:hypothetical protein